MSNLLRRQDAGKPIRDAMRVAGVSGPSLAEMTKRVDPTGRGVSPATIGNLAGRGATARDRCRLRTAWLIADALDQPIQRLFSMTADTTATVEL